MDERSNVRESFNLLTFDGLLLLIEVVWNAIIVFILLIFVAVGFGEIGGDSVLRFFLL